MSGRKSDAKTLVEAMELLASGPLTAEQKRGLRGMGRFITMAGGSLPKVTVREAAQAKAKGTIVRTADAPYGLKKDGTPAAKRGRKAAGTVAPAEPVVAPVVETPAPRVAARPRRRKQESVEV